MAEPNCERCGRPKVAGDHTHGGVNSDLCGACEDCPWCTISCRDHEVRILRVRNEYLSSRLGIVPGAQL